MTDFSIFSNPMKRGTYKFDARRVRNQHFSFEPTGPLRVVGDVSSARAGRTSNPVAERFDEQHSARLFVGLKVGDEEKYTLDEVLTIVRDVRVDQVGPEGDPGASFLYQKGIYRTDAGRVIDENSVQVIVLNLSGASEQEFEDQIITLAETIAKQMQQEKVYVEMQKNGVVTQTLKVVP